MSHTTEALKQRWNDRLPLCQAFRDPRGAVKWWLHVCPLSAPHLVKKSTVSHFARQFHCRSFVKTGTYYSASVSFARDKVDQIYTAEIGALLHQDAVKCFAPGKRTVPPHGDSAVVLPRILPELKSLRRFWLVGHSDCTVAARGDNNTPLVMNVHNDLIRIHPPKSRTRFTRKLEHV